MSGAAAGGERGEAAAVDRSATAGMAAACQRDHERLGREEGGALCRWWLGVALQEARPSGRRVDLSRDPGVSQVAERTVVCWHHSLSMRGRTRAARMHPE